MLEAAQTTQQETTQPVKPASLPYSQRLRLAVRNHGLALLAALTLWAAADAWASTSWLSLAT